MVPQQPPTSATPYSVVKRSWASASCSGESGYRAPSEVSSGSPAFGITLSGTGQCRASVRRCSLISAGPVAQLSPTRSTPSGTRLVTAASVSVPSSIVPCSSMVTWAMTAARSPVAASARLAPTTAAFVCSRSWLVSTSSASAPPTSRPSQHSW